MQILGISGSPRIGGNTDILLDKVLQGAKTKGAQTEKVILNTLKFSPCQECENIRDDGTCIVEDEMQPLYKKIEEADVIILASPIFFGSLSAQTKMMIDRFQCIWRAKYLGRKKIFEKTRKGIFICVEASHKKEFFDNARMIVRNFFVTVDVDCQKEIYCPGLDEKGEVLKYPAFLDEAFEAGKDIVKV